MSQLDATPDSNPGRRVSTMVVLAALGLVLAVVIGAGISLTGSTEPIVPSAGRPQALTTPDDNPPAAPAATRGSAPPRAAADPLNLAIPFVNRGCNGDFIVMLASSGRPGQYRSTLRKAIDAAPDAKYLVTDRSCGSFVQDLEGNRIWAAYDGPYASMRQACARRDAIGIGDSYVRQLDARKVGRDLCSCLRAPTALPRLNRRQDADPVTSRRFAIIDLQVLLYRAGMNSGALMPGTFGPLTQQWVRSFQARAGYRRTGRVTTQTWARLLRVHC